ncbi:MULTISPECIES: phosphoenolpyruvate--protein phosphotransferase [unclassified Bordetella]|uniref:phosphoenolpyruvate--protein phosphotransferase n=1 Tax=unclassified Bordetella TaxID=2630031 RepID=UPI00132A6D10|nr:MULTISPECIES: phosphoenolpyruvate--protein phosphotransferase [unclassified Bordetella]MVW71227.1 phosphoenolpyruvate--protein phosphotransferase [Bordetella sp. 15P40C-2]MVW80421.1 phosphoenolpyruvate--protein phosphotransferase [Bordetella sp. 02P26C-1]
MHGKGVARGYAIGRAVVMGAASLEVEHYRIGPEDITSECDRLMQALTVARTELQQLADSLPEDAPRELGAMLNVHCLLLGDPLLAEQTQALIQERNYNAEWALAAQGQILGEQFEAMEDEYLRERGADVRQVIERVLRVLSGRPAALVDPANLNGSDPLIVVAHDISPADMVRLRGGRFAAFVTDLGGPTSHTAIVARSMGVPAVVALGNVRDLVRDGDTLVVDGASGVVMVNPAASILQEFRDRQVAYAAERAALALLRDEPAITLDGITIVLNANIELPDEAEGALAAGADGIGLFRSEFLFMGRRSLPDEEEQYQAYANVVRTMAGRPVTIRTLDIGADKTLDDEATVATNPALGLRAIRYCLAHPEMFATQLRAILRASAHGHVRILLPMVAHMQEVRAALAAIDAARRELDARGQAYAPRVEVGAMVEVPATAIAIEPFAEALDFLSIGTNDLIQYTLAVDRGDHDVASLYDPLHPAVLRLVANTINVGARLGKPVAVCGEMAGDARLTRLLLGLGLTEFSMHSQQILDVKREILRAHSYDLRVKVATPLNRALRVDLDRLE